MLNYSIMVYNAVIGALTGICLGFGILYLFIGYRRHKHKSRNLTFALFALGYAATLLMGIAYQNVNSLTSYLALSRVDAIFAVTVLISLIWFVSAYTAFQPRLVLWALSAGYLIGGLGAFLSPGKIYADPVLTSLALSWGEQIYPGTSDH